MNKGRKINMLMAIDKMKGLPAQPRIYYAAKLETLYAAAQRAAQQSLQIEDGIASGGARPSIQQMILAEYESLKQQTGSNGGFVYGNINGETKSKEVKQKKAKPAGNQIMVSVPLTEGLLKLLKQQ